MWTASSANYTAGAGHDAAAMWEAFTFALQQSLATHVYSPNAIVGWIVYTIVRIYSNGIPSLVIFHFRRSS